MYKVADTFNGHVWSSHRFLDAANKALGKARRQFHQSNPGADFCGAIVPASAEWKYDHDAREFAWSETIDEGDQVYLERLG